MWNSVAHGIKLGSTVFALSLLGSCGNGSSPDKLPPHTANVTYQVQWVDGNPIWKGSEQNLGAGTTVHATLVNSLPEAHVFKAVGLTGPVIVPPGQTMTTDFVVPGTAVEITIFCALHASAETGIVHKVIRPLQDAP